MKKITSVTNQYIKSLYELNKNHEKKNQGLFLVDGIDFIEMANQENLLVCVLLLNEDKRFDNVEQIIVTEQFLNKLSTNKTSQNMIGVCKYKVPSEIKVNNKLLYLDGVQDPGNVGTLIRTALAFNYDGVILSEDSASLYNDKVISSTKGAIFKMNIYQGVSLNKLKDDGFDIISTSLEKAVNYKEYTKKENLLLSDVIVKIPMDNIDSLNVAIAGGILMNEYR